MGGAGCALIVSRTDLAPADPGPGGAVDIRRFGAVGDGTHNDSAALAAALRAAPAVYVPAGTYVVDHVMVPSGRSIHTDGYLTKFRQRPGTPDGMRLLNVIGSNVQIDSCTVEGNIASDRGEQHHGIFIEAGKSTGDLTNIVIGNVHGRNMRGDVVYVGSANGSEAKHIRVGQVFGSNVLRNVVSIVGGIGITVESVRGSNVGYTHLDIEPDNYNGPVIGCVIGSVQGAFVQIAGQTSEAFVDKVKIGLLDLLGNVRSSVPFYLPGAKRTDALTVRNVRTLAIGRLIARDFDGAAIRQIWDPGSLTDQRLHIAIAELRNDCRRVENARAYIQGNRRATRLTIDTLMIDISRGDVDAVLNCKEARIGTVHGKLPTGSHLIAESDASPLGLLYFVGATAAVTGAAHIVRRLIN